MKIGTKSILFGVHQFLWHSITVALAWRLYHNRWPVGKAEWIAIFCHDLGYWGCGDMDGVEGKEHPLGGALLAGALLKSNPAAQQKAMILILGHSKYFSAAYNLALSDLHAPDKLSILFEPEWFYLLRGGLTGEVWEFMSYAPKELSNPSQWFRWYQQKTREKFL